MAVAINNNSRPETDLDKIVKGLTAAKDIFGVGVDLQNIQQLMHKNTLASQQEELNSQRNDPNSAISKHAQAEEGATIDSFANKHYIPQETASKLKQTIFGTPALAAQPAVGPATEKGDLPAGGTSAQAAVPALSASQLDKNSELSPLSKFVAGAQSADASRVRLEGLTRTKEEANQMRANNAYDTNIGKKYEDRLDAANRVKILLGNAMNGQLIPSENLGQQLATDINVLQAGHSSVSGTQHSRPNTLFGKVGQLVHFASGDATPAITQSDLGQMLKETDMLYGEIGTQHQNKFNSWVKGQPQEVRPMLVDRFNTSRQQYFPGGGGDASQPSGGSPMPGSNAQAGTFSPHPQDSDAVTWAKSNPKDPRSAQILKMNGGM